MKLLVTGGAGFIGSNFIKYWLHKHPSDHIVNLDSLTYAGNLESLKIVENKKNYLFIKGSICDAGLVNQIIKGVDVVVNFAAESHVDRSIENSADFIHTNVEGTRILLDAALKHSLGKFHHVSTDEVFGALSMDDDKFNEHTAYDPRSPYSASKASSDHLVRSYFHTHGLPITISNCSNNYGPCQFPEKLIPLFVTNLMEGKKVPVYGKGENIRDWIHVDDHNKGIDMIIQKGNPGETYCLGGDNELTNMQVVEMILDYMTLTKDQITYVKDRPGHDLRYAIDFSKAKKELGWEPKIKFKDGLATTIEWYNANSDWWKKIKSGEYKDYYDKQYGRDV